MASKKSGYSEQDVVVLKGLEPVRSRPGMYTRTENPNHIVQEIVDNAQDEALAGFARAIQVELHADGSVSVEDDGRGIPPEKHSTEGVSTIEVVFTRLHAGAKIKKGHGLTYGFTGGLHGVGVSVTNALSSTLEVTVWRDGWEHTMTFTDGAPSPLKKSRLPAEQATRHGTRVHAWPNPAYFDHPAISTQEMERYLRSKAVLLKGTQITWLRPDRPPTVWVFERGLPQYLQEQSADENPWVAPVFHADLSHATTANGFEAGEGLEIALAFSAEGRAIRESYVNLIATPDGGRHETGLRAGMLEAVRSVAERLGAIPKGIRLDGDDVWSRMSFVLSVKLMDPQFQNQTKDRMTSEKGHRLVSVLMRDAMELWLNENPSHAQAIVELVVSEAVRRARTGPKVDRKRSVGACVLPGKLADCESRDLASAELFLVEGASAGGSSKNGRNRHTQAILPLRGKLLNTWEVESHKAMESETVSDVASAIGIDPHPGRTAAAIDWSRLRYGKVFIMADADVDGQHIQVLLLTLFLRHFPGLIERGHIWIAQAPLYRIDAPAKKGSKTGPRKIYAIDEAERDAVCSRLTAEGLTAAQQSVTRFKGLGEMNSEQLRETTMNPDGRRAVQIAITDAVRASKAFDRMMGKKNATQRKDWMEAEGSSVDLD